MAFENVIYLHFDVFTLQIRLFVCSGVIKDYVIHFEAVGQYLGA